MMPLLHPTETCQALFPSYVGRFRCIGPDCEATCCSGWDISLDQATAEAYTIRLQPYLPALTKRLENRILIQAKSPSRKCHAKMLNDPGTDDCPGLDAGLCAIQREYGEDKLANTCFDYPRYTRSIQGSIEQTMTLSCPEAARLALLEADAFDFSEGELSLRPETVSPIAEKWGISLDDMNEIRIFCFQIMRSEGLQLWEKLVVLGAFCRELDRVITTEKSHAVGDLLGNFQFVLESGEIVTMISKIQPDYEFQARLFHTVWKTRREQLRSPMRQRVQDAIALALQADRDGALLENYRRGLANLPAALAATPHLLEHYVLNEMFRDFFPFGASSAFQNYQGIIFRFGCLRFMLAAQSVDAGALPDRETLIGTVVTFCRIYQYDSLAELFNEALKTVGWDRLEDAFGLLPG